MARPERELSERGRTGKRSSSRKALANAGRATAAKAPAISRPSVFAMAPFPGVQGGPNKRRKGESFFVVNGENNSEDLVNSDPQVATVLVRRPRLGPRQDDRGHGRDVDVLLDSCSSISLVTPNLINILHLEIAPNSTFHEIIGSVPGVQHTKGGVTITLCAR